MAKCETCPPTCNCPMMGRRGFITAMSLGASALAMKTGLLDFASTVVAGEPKPAGGPKVRAFFLRPTNQKEYWMSWPGETYDVTGSQALYTKIMGEAAQQQGVQLEVQSEPVADGAQLATLLGQLKQSPPEGVILTLMHMNRWGLVNEFVKKKGDLPAIVFAPMGVAFTGHLQATRNAPKTFVGSTQDVQWLGQAVRMFRSMWAMKKTRICIIAGEKTNDVVIPTVGTTMHYIPRERWPNEFDKTETTDEMRAIAAYYSKEAKKIVEPKPQDVLNAAKNYVIAKKIMAVENCQGISMDCLGLVRVRRIPCPPCIAWSRLLDEGGVGTCEADTTAAFSQLLSAQLTGRPGFMQDPVPNTVNNTFMGAHCTSPTRLAGFDKLAVPFLLRNHSESAMGCVPQVLWPLEQDVTVMKFASGDTMILGTGKVIGNIDTPPSGGCRTSVDLQMNQVDDSRDVKGFHQLFILGKQDHHFRAYAQLAGIKVQPIA